MKNIILLFVLFAVGFSSCGPSNPEADVFIGEWMDKKNPTQKWKIERNGSTFTGTRIGDVDFYKEKTTETWTVTTKKKIIQLTPSDKSGSTMTYIEGKNEIMRHPPGIVYQKIQNASSKK